MSAAKLPYQLSARDVLGYLESSPEGLSASQASERFHVDGPNKLTKQPHSSPFLSYMKQFGDPTVVLLLAAGLFAIAIEYSLIGYILLTLIVVNTAMQFAREYLPRSKQVYGGVLPERAHVRRDGKLHHIQTTGLVVGDVVELNPGDTVPADLRLMEAHGLTLDNRRIFGTQASHHAITHALAKETGLTARYNNAYQGAVVVAGHGVGVVTATGKHTELGAAAARTAATIAPTSPLQIALEHINLRSTQAALALAILITLAGLPFGLGYEQSLWFVLAIVVVVIPLALPSAVNIALTYASRGLARFGTFVRRLSAVDTLGLTNVAVVDAHDVLTHHTPVPQRLFIARQGYTFGKHDVSLLSHENGKPLDIEDAQKLKLLGSAAAFVHLPHTDAPLKDFAGRSGLDLDELAITSPELHKLPFDHARGRASSVRRFSFEKREQLYVFTAGNAEAVLERCKDIWVFGHVRKLSAADKTFIAKQLAASEKADDECVAFAFRTLPDSTKPESLAPDDAEQKLVWLGLMTLSHPLRSEIETALSRAHDSRLSVSTIVNGNPTLATVLTKYSALHVTGGKVLRVSQTEFQKMSDEKAASYLRRGGTLFMDVNSTGREQLVCAAQAHGEHVAVTGSGLIDIPALTIANTGILLAPDNDVRPAGEIVLKQTGFGLLVAAVTRGRALHRNLRKAALSLYEGAMAKLVVVLLSFVGVAVFDIPVAIALIQLLLLALMVELIPAAALGRDRVETDQPRVKARELTNRVLDRKQLPYIVWSGLVVGVLAFLNYVLYFGRQDVPIGLVPADTPLHWKAMTLALLTLALCQLATFALHRSHHGLFTRYQLHNSAFWGGSLSVIAALWVFMYIPFFSDYFKMLPLALTDWFFALLAVAVYVGLQEFVRYDRRHHRHHVHSLHLEIGAKKH